MAYQHADVRPIQVMALFFALGGSVVRDWWLTTPQPLVQRALSYMMVDVCH
ncbi:hypothetical protein [Exiguobacterium sp. SH4S7]|uniref:hypothetical protein n=1 Tax=Exiguobacterium sp. SH4S7 TaxID=2510958 RepID=UPI001375F6FF|nr:hypothetical protein [Exiguobacterium sp. SH4S7]